MNHHAAFSLEFEKSLQAARGRAREARRTLAAPRPIVGQRGDGAPLLGLRRGRRAPRRRLPPVGDLRRRLVRRAATVELVGEGHPPGAVGLRAAADGLALRQRLRPRARALERRRRALRAPVRGPASVVRVPGQKLSNVPSRQVRPRARLAALPDAPGLRRVRGLLRRDDLCGDDGVHEPRVAHFFFPTAARPGELRGPERSAKRVSGGRGAPPDETPRVSWPGKPTRASSRRHERPHARLRPRERRRPLGRRRGDLRRVGLDDAPRAVPAHRQGPLAQGPRALPRDLRRRRRVRVRLLRGAPASRPHFETPTSDARSAEPRSSGAVESDARGVSPGPSESDARGGAPGPSESDAPS